MQPNLDLRTTKIDKAHLAQGKVGSQLRQLELADPGCLDTWNQISWANEAAVDAGGPSRAFVDDSLNFYLKGAGNVFEGEENLVAVPKAERKNVRKMFYLGKIASYALRQGVPFNLPPLPLGLFEMMIKGVPVQDGEEFFFQRRPHYRPEVMLPALESGDVELFFEIDLKYGGNQLELVVGGGAKPVTSENYESFVNLASRKVNQNTLYQYKALANGLKEHVSPLLLKDMGPSDFKVLKQKDLKGGPVQQICSAGGSSFWGGFIGSHLNE